MSVKRFDRFKLDAIARDQNGFVRTRANATRVGVFCYQKPDGSIFRELRPPEEVFKADSLSSLKGVPLTNKHPEVGLLSPENVKKFMVGFTGEVLEKKPFIETEVVITDTEAIEDVEGGVREVSCGYTCDVEDESGVWEGEEYDAIQKNIVYNHLAIVDRGRGGPQVRLHLDAADAEQIENQEEIGNQEKEKQMKFKLGDKEIEISEADAQILQAYLEGMKSADEMEEEMDGMKEKLNEKEKEMSDMKENYDKAQALVDGQKSKIDSLEKELKSKTDSVDASKVREMVKARMAVESVARRVLDSKEIEKLDSMDDKQIKLACIEASSEGIKLDGKSDAYVDARFDMLSEEIEKREKAGEDLGELIIKGRQDGAKDPVVEARQKYVQDSQEAWKKPLAAMKNK